ncbi:hypothetical protein ACFE04_027251 [Oxalis oulophora]
MVYCYNCAMQVTGVRPFDSQLCCNFCGRVLEDINFSSEATFVKNSTGQSQMAGNYVRTIQNDLTAAHDRALHTAKDEIRYLQYRLQMADDDGALLRQAHGFYTVGFLASRLCCISLIPEDNAEVIKTARDIIASMKRDWMQTGRKPSGLCGAALYISALSHGIKCSKLDVVKVVHICEATLTKRLIEFENTESGSLSELIIGVETCILSASQEAVMATLIEEFLGKAKESQICSAAKQPKNASGRDEFILCRHKEKEPYAYGLCKECHDDFMTISGGTEGGLDPPAFQIAERERIAKLSAEENRNEEADVGTSQKSKEAMEYPTAGRFENLHSEEPDSIGTVKGQVSANDDSCDKLPGVDNGNDVVEESENLSDIDDVEVDCYLHTEEERSLKKIIWEKVNWEYVEEQAAKEAAVAAAKAAFEAKYKGCPEELRAAQELAAATEAAVAKSKKERQQKRAADAKNAPPPQNAAEATRQMLDRKRLSKNVNQDVLDKLFDEFDPPEKAKKQRLDENDDEDNYTVGKKELKSEGEHENGDDLGLEDGFENEGGEEEADYEQDYKNFDDEEEYYGDIVNLQMADDDGALFREAHGFFENSGEEKNY